MLPADRFVVLSLEILWELCEMAVEFAKVAGVWHHFRADVSVTFCSRALGLLKGNTLDFFS